jgi:SAM-dependent methyltransferase
MTQTTVRSLTEEEADQRDAFVERILSSVGGAFDIFTMHIGFHMGFYDALAAHSHTSTSLAGLTDTQERYVREWLEQQTVTGMIEVLNPEDPYEERRFRLPAAHAEVLTDRESPNYILPLAPMIAGAVRPIMQLLEAFRDGGGVPYSEYGADFREGQGAINRVTFLQDLPNVWLPAMPDVHANLSDEQPARVADIGTGAGWSSIGLALNYSHVSVDGYDLDAPSIELARQNAKEAGLDGRVNFHVRDAGDPELAGQYDLVMAMECIHDLSDPVSVLSSMRRLAGEDGAVIVVDERVGDNFTPEGNDVEWMMYGWSVLHCLPVGLSKEHGHAHDGASAAAGTGTVMRRKTLRQYAEQAGFREVEVLPIDNFFFRIYRLHQ